MNKTQVLIVLLMISCFTSCIKDDFITDNVEPELRITTTIDAIALNTTFQLENMYLNNIGVEEAITASWSSSDESIISVNSTGLISAVNLGTATITTSFTNGAIQVSDAITLVVGAETVTTERSLVGDISTTSSYKLGGTFDFAETANGITLAFGDNYCASTALPGLYIYLSNNRNSIANALEVGSVQVFEGAHEYSIPNVGFSDYAFIVYFCKPFNVKVGEGEL